MSKEFDQDNLQPAESGYDHRLRATLKKIKSLGVGSSHEFFMRLLEASKFGSGELYHQLALEAQKFGGHKLSEHCLEQSDKSFAPYQDHGRARLYRDWALIAFRDHDFTTSFAKLEDAYLCHDKDIDHAEMTGDEGDIKKGYHHLHVTQNIAAYIEAAAKPSDTSAREALIASTLDTSQGWGYQERMQAIGFAEELCQNHPRYAELIAQKRVLRLQKVIQPIAGTLAVGMTAAGVARDMRQKFLALNRAHSEG